jgi:hypothetical protein
MPVIERNQRFGIGCEPSETSQVTIDNGKGVALDLKGGVLVNAVINGAVAPGGVVISGNTDPTKMVRFYFDVSVSPIILKLQTSTDSGTTWTDVPGVSWELA